MEKKKAGEVVTDADFKNAVDKVLSDKESVESFLNEAKASYDKEEVEAEAERAKTILAAPPAPIDCGPFPVNAEAVPKVNFQPMSASTAVSMIRFTCPACKKRLKAAKKNGGRRGKCTFCGEKSRHSCGAGGLAPLSGAPRDGGLHILFVVCILHL